MTAKRDALRAKLIDAAENRMTADGLTGLRARDVAKDAGVALGGIYTAFGDLDELVLHVNARTLGRIDTAMQPSAELAPRDALRAIALDYARFARTNRPLWDALFDHKASEDIPDWFREHQRAVMAHIVRPLAALQPNLEEDVLHLRARTYFSAFHGIVSISLQGRFVGLPGDTLEAEIERFVDVILAGSLDAAP